MDTHSKSLFSVAVSPTLPAIERDAFVATLRVGADVQEPTTRGGADWAVFIAVMKDTGVIAGALAALVKLANEINAWRKSVRQRGVSPEVKLQHPDMPSLDLRTATDKEVEEWMSRLT